MNENGQAQLRMFIELVHEGIERTVQRQSSELYRILIAQAAVFGLFLLLLQIENGERITHWIVCLLVAAEVILTGLGCAFLHFGQTTLDHRRCMLEDEREGYYRLLEEPIQTVVLGRLGVPPAGRKLHPQIYALTLILSGAFLSGIIVLLGMPELR